MFGLYRPKLVRLLEHVLRLGHNIPRNRLEFVIDRILVGPVARIKRNRLLNQGLTKVDRFRALIENKKDSF